ncbi:MAG: peptidoglycan-binding protein [bacterium]|nr:peptidoglycan-binding protein [bacterium]
MNRSSFSMFKKIAFAGLGLVLLASPLMSSADAISDLQAQIQALLAQVAALQAQVGLPTPAETHPIIPTSQCVVLTYNMGPDDTDADTNGEVSKLQRFLAQDPSIYPEGRITGYFGFATMRAVQRWQAAHSLAHDGDPDSTGYGFVGPRTRAAMAAGCGGGNQTITVTAPNGGEQWETGIMNTVTWTPYQYGPDINPAKDVTAYLEQKETEPNGVFVNIGPVQEDGKASIHWMTGHINMTKGDYWAKPGGNYYIRVVNNVTGAWDRSDAPFTILPRSVDLKVNSSDGPLTIDPAQKVWITWSSTDKDSCTAYGVSDAQVSPSNNQPPMAGLPASGKREVYVWFYNAGYGMQVNMQCTGTNGSVASDWVVINPVAQPASLQITSPNGGESIPLDYSQQYIRWNQSGVSQVSIALYKNDQWQEWIHKDFIPFQQPDGTYAFGWQGIGISNPGFAAGLGTVYKIYITGQRTDGSGYVDDKSDAPFSFVTGGGLSLEYISGKKDTYTPGESVDLVMRALKPDGTPGTPEDGFNIQMYVTEPNSPSVFQGENAEYKYATKLWKVPLRIPYAAGTYKVESTFYCSNTPLACGTTYRIAEAKATFYVTISPTQEIKRAPIVVEAGGDLGGNATIKGHYLVGTDNASTNVYIGGTNANVTFANYGIVNIDIPSSLTVGNEYDLTVVNDRGTSNTLRFKVPSVKAGGGTSLTATPTSGSAPLSVTFSSNSASDVRFGDGQTGTLNPAPVCSGCAPSYTALHTYTSAGTFTASANGISKTITVTASQASPRIVFNSISGGTVSFSYYDLPTNSEVVFVNQTSGQTVSGPVAPISSSGTGTQTATAPSSMPAGAYYLKVRNVTTQAEIARSVSFTVAGNTGAPTCTLSASPASITSGQSSTLSWTSGNSASASIDRGVGAQPLNGSVIVSPPSTLLYTLTATAEDGRTATCTKTITVTAVAVLPSVTITAPDASASEAGLATGSYLITRTGPTTQALGVTVEVSGSATRYIDSTTSNPDYILTQSGIASGNRLVATIPANSATTNILLTPKQDTLKELTETVVIRLVDGANYNLGTPISATVRITDNDTVSLNDDEVRTNLASALSALESALQALIRLLGQTQ